MIYVNYCHKNNISDSKMSFFKAKNKWLTHIKKNILQ